MAFIVLLAFGLGASLVASHTAFWWLERRNKETEMRDTRFDKDAKYARLFHSKPNRLRHA